MTNFLRVGSLIVISVVSTGCATIVSKAKYPVTITTEPTAATVEVKDRDGVVRFAGTSPATVVLDAGAGYFKRANYTITASKEGYNPATLSIKGSLDGWYFGNILFGGLIGMLIVDPVTGAMYEIDNAVAALTLNPVVSPASTHGDRLKQLQDLRSTGVLTESEYQSKRKAVLRDL